MKYSCSKSQLTSGERRRPVYNQRYKIDSVDFFARYVYLSVCLSVCPFVRHIKPVKGKGCPYSITERSVPELIPVLDSQPAGDVSHKPGGRLPLLSARPAVTTATLKRAATNFAAW